MPLLFEKKASKSARLAVWQIAEPELFFLEKLRLAPAELAELAPIVGNRRLHWLAGRAVLHQISGEKKRLEIAKSAFGKPFWAARPEAHFSLSHSGSLAAAIVDGERPCGIDVERVGSKIERIAPRFLTEKELLAADGEAEKLHFFWGAKESIYKAYGLRELDFRLNIGVDSFSGGWAEKGPIRLDFDLFEQKIALKEELFDLVWAIGR